MTLDIMLEKNNAVDKALIFNKRTVADLSDFEMLEINGGGTPAISSGYCIGAAAAGGLFLISAVIGYFD
jgi:lactobin A/cerein 7B family class IIb bacteriocin